MEEYKKKTIGAYDRYPDAFDNKFERHFRAYVRADADDFIGLLPGRAIVDLGAGPGNHAAYFKERGLEVLCVDLSDEMLRRCRAKGLPAVKADVEDLSVFPDGAYDGIWAYAVLLHVPKEKVPGVVHNMARMLRPRGLVGLAVKKPVLASQSQGLEPHEDFPGTERWFSYFSDDDVRAHFRDFSMLDFRESRSRAGSRTAFLHYVLQKK